MSPCDEDRTGAVPVASGPRARRVRAQQRGQTGAGRACWGWRRVPGEQRPVARCGEGEKRPCRLRSPVALQRCVLIAAHTWAGFVQTVGKGLGFASRGRDQIQLPLWYARAGAGRRGARPAQSQERVGAKRALQVGPEPGRRRARGVSAARHGDDGQRVHPPAQAPQYQQLCRPKGVAGIDCARMLVAAFRFNAAASCRHHGP